MSGCSGSFSILARSRCTCTLTSRVSAACRYPHTCSSSTSRVNTCRGLRASATSRSNSSGVRLIGSPSRLTECPATSIEMSPMSSISASAASSSTTSTRPFMTSSFHVWRSVTAATGDHHVPGGRSITREQHTKRIRTYGCASNTALGHYGGHQVRRRDVEGGIVGRGTCWRHLVAREGCDLPRGAPLHVDLLAARRVKINRGRRRHHDERHAVPLGENGQAVGANLVGDA